VTAALGAHGKIIDKLLIDGDDLDKKLQNNIQKI
jgi:hypothetical protein